MKNKPEVIPVSTSSVGDTECGRGSSERQCFESRRHQYLISLPSGKGEKR